MTFFSLRRWMFLLACTASLWAAQAGAQVAASDQCGTFTIAMIPDTQNYIDYLHQKASGYPIDAVDMFYEQMQYIADHAKSAGGDIVFATSVGDVWQHYSLAMDPGHAARGFKGIPNAGSSEVAVSPREEAKKIEIPSAIKGYQILAGRLPFSVVPGNHDYDALWTDPAHPARLDLTGPARVGIRHVGGLSNFQSAFSNDSDFFRGKAWYVDSHDGGADSAQLFTAGGCRFLHIGLQFDAPNASLAWAAGVIKRFPSLPTIVSTHKYLDPDGKRAVDSVPDNSALDPEDNNPQIVWNKFISQNDQIFLVLSGHIGGQGYSVALNRSRHQVHQMLADYQGRWQVAKDLGLKDPSATLGDGWMRLLTLHLDDDRPYVRVETYSTYYKKYSSQMKEYASWYKEHEGLSKLPDDEYMKRENFVISLDDFHKRFDTAMKRSNAFRN